MPVARIVLVLLHARHLPLSSCACADSIPNPMDQCDVDIGMAINCTTRRECANCCCTWAPTIVGAHDMLQVMIVMLPVSAAQQDIVHSTTRFAARWNVPDTAGKPCGRCGSKRRQWTTTDCDPKQTVIRHACRLCFCTLSGGSAAFVFPLFPAGPLPLFFHFFRRVRGLCFSTLRTVRHKVPQDPDPAPAPRLTI